MALGNPQAAPARLRVRAGDLLVIDASGGRVVSGEGAVELLGAFLQGVPTGAGEVIEPAGPPSQVVLRAVAAGRATIELYRGDPFGGQTRPLHLALEIQEQERT